jgi:hypothetical protein
VSDTAGLLASRWLLRAVTIIILGELLLTGFAGLVQWAVRDLVITTNEGERQAAITMHSRLAIALWAWAAIHALVLGTAALRGWGSGWLLALVCIELVDLGAAVYAGVLMLPGQNWTLITLSWALGLVPVAVILLLVVRARLPAG